MSLYIQQKQYWTYISAYRFFFSIYQFINCYICRYNCVWFYLFLLLLLTVILLSVIEMIDTWVSVIHPKLQIYYLSWFRSSILVMKSIYCIRCDDFRAHKTRHWNLYTNKSSINKSRNKDVYIYIYQYRLYYAYKTILQGPYSPKYYPYGHV